MVCVFSVPNENDPNKVKVACTLRFTLTLKVEIILVRIGPDVVWTSHPKLLKDCLDALSSDEG